MTDFEVKELSHNYGVSEDLAARAVAAGIGFDDISEWIKKYGAGIVALFREVLDDYQSGRLHGWGAALVVLGYWRKYGAGVLAFLDELFSKLGVGKPKPGDGGIAG